MGQRRNKTQESMVRVEIIEINYHPPRRRLRITDSRVFP